MSHGGVPSSSSTISSSFFLRGLTGRASRTERASSRNSCLPATTAATCAACGKVDTAAAALIDTSPRLTASTNSGAAALWICSICPSVLLDRRAARASAARVSAMVCAGIDDFAPAASDADASPAAGAVGSAPATGASGVSRPSRMVFLRSASTPRW